LLEVEVLGAEGDLAVEEEKDVQLELGAENIPILRNRRDRPSAGNPSLI